MNFSSATYLSIWNRGVYELGDYTTPTDTDVLTQRTTNIGSSQLHGMAYNSYFQRLIVGLVSTKDITFSISGTSYTVATGMYMSSTLIPANSSASFLPIALLDGSNIPTNMSALYDIEYIPPDDATYFFGVPSPNYGCIIGYINSSKSVDIYTFVSNNTTTNPIYVKKHNILAIPITRTIDSTIITAAKNYRIAWDMLSKKLLLFSRSGGDSSGTDATIKFIYEISNLMSGTWSAIASADSYVKVNSSQGLTIAKFDTYSASGSIGMIIGAYGSSTVGNNGLYKIFSYTSPTILDSVNNLTPNFGSLNSGLATSQDIMGLGLIPTMQTDIVLTAERTDINGNPVSGQVMAQTTVYYRIRFHNLSEFNVENIVAAFNVKINNIDKPYTIVSSSPLGLSSSNFTIIRHNDVEYSDVDFIISVVLPPNSRGKTMSITTSYTMPLIFKNIGAQTLTHSTSIFDDGVHVSTTVNGNIEATNTHQIAGAYAFYKITFVNTSNENALDTSAIFEVKKDGTTITSWTTSSSISTNTPVTYFNVNANDNYVCYMWIPTITSDAESVFDITATLIIDPYYTNTGNNIATNNFTLDYSPAAYIAIWSSGGSSGVYELGDYTQSTDTDLLTARLTGISDCHGVAYNTEFQRMIISCVVLKSVTISSATYDTCLFMASKIVATGSTSIPIILQDNSGNPISMTNKAYCIEYIPPNDAQTYFGFQSSQVPYGCIICLDLNSPNNNKNVTIYSFINNNITANPIYVKKLNASDITITFKRGPTPISTTSGILFRMAWDIVAKKLIFVSRVGNDITPGAKQTKFIYTGSDLTTSSWTGNGDANYYIKIYSGQELLVATYDRYSASPYGGILMGAFGSSTAGINGLYTVSNYTGITDITLPSVTPLNKTPNFSSLNPTYANSINIIGSTFVPIMSVNVYANTIQQVESNGTTIATSLIAGAKVYYKIRLDNNSVYNVENIVADITVKINGIDIIYTIESTTPPGLLKTDFTIARNDYVEYLISAILPIDSSNKTLSINVAPTLTSIFRNTNNSPSNSVSNNITKPNTNVFAYDIIAIDINNNPITQQYSGSIVYYKIIFQNTSSYNIDVTNAELYITKAGSPIQTSLWFVSPTFPVTGNSNTINPFTIPSNTVVPYYVQIDVPIEYGNSILQLETTITTDPNYNNTGSPTYQKSFNLSNIFCIHPDMIVDELDIPIKNVEKYGDDYVNNLHMGYTNRFVRIKQSAFGKNVPNKDLLLTGSHPIMHNNKEIAVKSLVDGVNVVLDYLDKPVEVRCLSFESRKTIKMHGIDVWQWAQKDFECMLKKNNLEYINDKIQRKI